MKKEYEGIAIHCSDSKFGNAQTIEDWHKNGNKWSDIGYHFVILNGHIENNSHLMVMAGRIEAGRDMDLAGAHVKGYNDWIGICLIGVNEFTLKQFESLAGLIEELVRKFGIPRENIKGHYQFDTAGGKTCPNFDVDKFKDVYLNKI